ncbi:uncharacterized protein TNCV_2537681 [Trichonephila clavipes]|nr:uncharacterized protein TNCV_2537681 [Trichonephila clavipes]
MRNHLHATYLGRWIRRVGRVAWPPHSPDLNPLNFFFWGYLKSFAYEVLGGCSPTTRIVVSSANIASTPNSFERVRQSSFIGVDCALTYATSTSNNASDNYFMFF